FLLQPAATTAVNLGVGLCRPTSITISGAAAVLFARWNPTTQVFDIYANHTTSTNCLNSMNTIGATKIDSIPAGHTVFLAITQGPLHTVTYTDEDLTTNTGGNTNFGGFTFRFRLAGIGSNGVQS